MFAPFKRFFALPMRRSLALMVLGLVAAIAQPLPLTAAEGDRANPSGSASQYEESGSRGSWFRRILERWFGRSEPAQDTTTQAINGGQPVPAINNDDSSATFLKERIAEEALSKHGANYAQALQTYDGYSNNLAKTLSSFSAEEQEEIIYGRR